MDTPNAASQGPSNQGRRTFLQGSAGLTLALYLAPARTVIAADATHFYDANAFISIGTDDSVTVIAKHLEMGQGTYTGLATLAAEELDADWAKVRVEGAPADNKRYGNKLMGGIQGTGGSNAMAASFEVMRQAGASARAMLVAAAARRWGVAPESITVKNGVVHHAASGRHASFGQLAEAAAQETVPQAVKLKDPKDFTLIGKTIPRQDTRDKINGRAMFTQDVQLPGQLTALVAYPPRFGGKVERFDATAAKAVAGVVDVVAIPSGVAVVAKDFWSAKKGRDALKVDWDESAAFRLGSPDILAQFKELAAKPGAVARHDGDVAAGLAGAAKRLEASYEFPYLAHAAMEPMDCVVRLSPEGCEVWNGEQFQTVDQGAIAKVLGLKPEQVKIHMLYAGGSFGRRANPHSDYLLDAVHIAKAMDGKAPVKLVRTREDDMRAGYYRPAYLHRLQGGLDGSGHPVAWQQRIVGQSIIAGTAFSANLIKNGVDLTSVEGAANLPYAIPNLQVDLHSPELPVPVQWWRSVGSTHTAYATETFADELARAAGQDPVAWRRSLLKNHPRHLGVLELAAAKAGWDRPLAPGKAGERRGRGVALHESFNTVVAQVAEVTVQADGSFRVERVVCAVDCGLAINPDVVRAQMEGGIGFGLAAALSGAITFKDGQVEQSNFDDYPVLRLPDMPRVEVHIVPSAAPPTGVGEPGTPVIAPAVANALFAATGKRLYKLPFDTAALKA